MCSVQSEECDACIPRVTHVCDDTDDVPPPATARGAPVPSLSASLLPEAAAVLGLSLCLFCPLDGVPEDPSTLATRKAQTCPSRVLHASLGVETTRCVMAPGGIYPLLMGVAAVSFLAVNVHTQICLWTRLFLLGEQ